MTKSLLTNNTSNCFKFIMTPSRGKACSIHCRNGTLTLLSGKIKDCKQHALVTYVTKAL